MSVIINDKRLVITIESKNFHSDLSKHVDNNLKHENDIQECGKQ